MWKKVEGGSGWAGGIWIHDLSISWNPGYVSGKVIFLHLTLLFGEVVKNQNVLKL